MKFFNISNGFNFYLFGLSIISIAISGYLLKEFVNSKNVDIQIENQVCNKLSPYKFRTVYIIDVSESFSAYYPKAFNDLSNSIQYLSNNEFIVAYIFHGEAIQSWNSKSDLKILQDMTSNLISAHKGLGEQKSQNIAKIISNEIKDANDCVEQVRFNVFSDFLDTINEDKNENGLLAIHDQVINAYFVDSLSLKYINWELIKSNNFLNIYFKPNHNYKKIQNSMRYSSDLPLPPIPGHHIASGDQIIWKWVSSMKADLYKWNFKEDIGSATNVGLDPTYIETNLIPDSIYVRFIWACNSHGNSKATRLTCRTIPVDTGMNYGGGVIFFLDSTSRHGFIASKSDKEISNKGQGRCVIESFESTLTDIGAGYSNTQIILNSCKDQNNPAYICSNLELNGYDDWFLPSKDELELMYRHKDVIGGFKDAFYCSSSYKTSTMVWYQDFRDGSMLYANFEAGGYLRPIRKF